MLGVSEEMLRQARRVASAGFLTLMRDLCTDGGAGAAWYPPCGPPCPAKAAPTRTSRPREPTSSMTPTAPARSASSDSAWAAPLPLWRQAAGAAAASANDGRLPKDTDKVLADACTVVASYGGRDRGLKGDGVRPDPEASADAWRRIEAFSHAHLKRAARA